MTEDILARLFYGQVSPFDDTVEDIESFRELNHELSGIWTEIQKQAPPELMELLVRYKVCRADIEMLTQLDRFKVGFRLGVQLATAATGGAEISK